MMLTPKGLNQTDLDATLEKLSKQPPILKGVLSNQRIKTYQISHNQIKFNYACSHVTDSILDALQHLAQEQQVIEKYQELLSGKYVNRTEKRAVTHHLTRSSQKSMYQDEQSRIKIFCEKVQSGEIKGSTGKLFSTVVQVGIGGSELGPKAICTALSETYTANYKFHFISNIDPAMAKRVLDSIQWEETLFIFVSKSGGTLETCQNERFIRDYLSKKGLKASHQVKHMLSVTTQGSQLDISGEYVERFYIDDSIGGRYSVTSAVGGLIISLVFGVKCFELFLAGAAHMDEQALHPSCTDNMALMSALITVWNRVYLKCSAKCIVNYGDALRYFGNHIQQLECESNGKSATAIGGEIDYQTGPIIVSGVGCNDQHSFFQLLHQGTQSIPVEWIAVANPIGNASDLREEMKGQLNENVIAQMVALAQGQSHANQRKWFPGNRASSLFLLKDLGAESLGALLSVYENATMFQGFLWGINSFDQEGVQLGKALSNQVANAEKNSVLGSFLDWFNF
tara:strand:+ start:3863 stop:5395 length:1533 start_codon:yes stop_codon:yes gene_type:complete